MTSNEVLGVGECGCCGSEVLIKLNKNGCAYYYCNGNMADGSACCHHQRWGKSGTTEIKNTLQGMTGNDKDTTSKPTTDERNSADAGEQADKPTSSEEYNGDDYGGIFN